jgi:hypothetical protein
LTDSTAALSLAVPAYFHPVVAPRDWRRLGELAHLMRFVIVNVHNGPGENLDPPYLPVIDALKAAGVRTIGYIDTDYGRRDPAELGREARTYRERYGVEGVFLDQVSSGLDELDHFAQSVVAVRTAGAHFVVLNPGTDCHPGYVDLANVTVTFEGSWAEYRSLRVPDWMHRWPKKRFAHLVHSVPKKHFSDALELAAGRHVDSVYFSDGRGANPWGHLPTPLPRELNRARVLDGRSSQRGTLRP